MAGCGGAGCPTLWVPTYFLPDATNWSYSTAILQDRAWRLWAAEQLVFTTLAAGGVGGGL